MKHVCSIALATTVLSTLLSTPCLGQQAFGPCVDGRCPNPPSANRAVTSFGEAVSTAPFASVSCRVKNGSSLGSGTVIGSGGESQYVLTCHHIFRSATGRVECAFVDGTTLAAQVVVVDAEHDLAVLKLASPRPTSIRVASNQSDSLLTACGFGISGRLRAIRGNVIGRARTAGAEFPSLRIAATVMSGDSGGGVFDSQGELCGVVWGVRNRVAYATPLAAIIRLVDRLQVRAFARPDSEAPPSIDLHAGWRAGVDSELEQLDRRIDRLRDSLPDPLTQPPPVDPLPRINREVDSKLATWRGKLLDDVKSLVGESIRERLSQLPKAAASWSMSQIAVGGASLASPVGLGLVAGAWLLRRRRRGMGGPRDERFPN